MEATTTRDEQARRHGRFLYWVKVDGTLVGSVARWGDERRWTMNASWLPSVGHAETPEEAGRVRQTRRAAVEDLVDMARAFGPLAGRGR